MNKNYFSGEQDSYFSKNSTDNELPSQETEKSSKQELKKEHDIKLDRNYGKVKASSRIIGHVKKQD